MYKAKKILYPSIIAICVACPVFAVDIDTNGQIDGSNAMCRIGALGTDNTDNGSPVKFKARWEPNQYTCVPGYYLDHLTATCLPCTVNNFCEGGTFIYDDTKDAGLTSCSEYTENKHPYSDTMSSTPTLCYKTGTDSCSIINKLKNYDGVNTIQYATSGNSVSYRTYYPDAFPASASIGACEITSLTCKNGYTLTPASNGALSNYIGQSGNISRANTKWRARNGSTTDNYSSSTSMGYGDSTGMTNGTVEYAWTDGAKIHMRTSCNDTRPTSSDETWPNSTFNPSSTGSICWCNMDSYTTRNGTTVSVTDTVWANVFKGLTASECADNCSYRCFAYFHNNFTFENLLLGTYGQQMSCEIVQYHCNDGYYLPANSTTCALCPSGKYCPEGDYLLKEVNQGINSCPTNVNGSSVYSAPGAYSKNQCYITSTKDCPSLNPYTGGHGTASYPNATNSNATVMTYYDNSGSYTGDVTALTPLNACAMTLSCDTGYTSTTAGALSNYVLQDMFTQLNKNISYLEVDGLTNSETQISGGSFTGFQNGEYRLTWSDNTSIHGFASCTVNATDSSKYDCNCSLDSYSLLGGTTVSVSPAKMYKENTYEDSYTCQSKCAFKCAVEGIATESSFRSNLFGDLGAQPICEQNAAVTVNCNPGTYLPANTNVCQPCTANHYCDGGQFFVKSIDQGLKDCISAYPYSDIGAREEKQCYKTGSVACATFNPRNTDITNYAKETGATYANQNASYREYNGSSAGQILDNIGACAVTALNCVTGYAMNTPGALANYTLQSMLWVYNTNIKYLALDSSTSTGGSSSGNDQGATTGMTPGDWEIKWSNDTKVNGNASCALNADNKYDCNCNLTSYTITNGSAVSVSPARTVPVPDTYETLPICQAKCAAECANQISQKASFRTALFGTLGGQPYCDANTINLNWYNQNTLIQAGSCTYDGAVTFPSGPFTRTGWHTTGWQIRQ